MGVKKIGKGKRNSLPAWKVQLFMWWTLLLARWAVVREFLVYWAGIYMPLFIINMGICPKMTVENEDGDDVNLMFYSISYNIPVGRDTVSYNLTARLLWFFTYVDFSYEDCLKYTEHILPWNDLHQKRLDHPESTLVFKYFVAEDEKATVMTLGLKGLYNIQSLHTPNSRDPPTLYEISFNTINFLVPEDD